MYAYNRNKIVHLHSNVMEGVKISTHCCPGSVSSRIIYLLINQTHLRSTESPTPLLKSS